MQIVCGGSVGEKKKRKKNTRWGEKNDSLTKRRGKTVWWKGGGWEHGGASGEGGVGGGGAGGDWRGKGKDKEKVVFIAK